MDEQATILDRVGRIEHGFTHMQAEADRVFAAYPPAECFSLAKTLLASDSRQVRMVSVFLLGYLAPQVPEALRIMREEISSDPSWQVQEILAKAFDSYCERTGYEAALPTIRDWLSDPRPNVRRAVTEGLRIWTGRPYFDEHPEVAIELIAAHHADESEYLRKSVGNSLRDISRAHPELVRREIARWNLDDRRVRLTHKLASKLLNE